MARKVERIACGCGVIEKRGKWYHFRWTDEAGERHRESLKCTTIGAAKQKAEALSKAIEGHDWMPRVERKQLTFIDVATEYVEHVEQTAERTGGIEYTASTAKGTASPCD